METLDSAPAENEEEGRVKKLNARLEEVTRGILALEKIQIGYLQNLDKIRKEIKEAENEKGRIEDALGQG